jgi:hypothetical protein
MLGGSRAEHRVRAPNVHGLAPAGRPEEARLALLGPGLLCRHSSTLAWGALGTTSFLKLWQVYVGTFGPGGLCRAEDHEHREGLVASGRSLGSRKGDQQAHSVSH